MTSYIRRSYPGKKYESLNKREKTLLHLIHTNGSTDKLQHAAENIREAQIGVHKALIYYAKDVFNVADADAEQIEKSEAKILEWRSLSVDQIIDKYKAHA